MGKQFHYMSSITRRLWVGFIEKDSGWGEVLDYLSRQVAIVCAIT